MRHKLYSSLLLFFAALAMLMPVNVYGEADYPAPNADFYVLDEADVLSEETETIIIETGRNHEQTRSKPQIAVVTVESLQGISIEEYAVDLFEQWGIGQEEMDNGVLLLFSEGDREIRIEVGYGLEGRLTDGKTGRILDDHLEHLSDDEFDEGIAEIFEDLTAEVNNEYLIETDNDGRFIEPTEEEAQQIRVEQQERRRQILKIVLWTLGIGLLALGILVAVWMSKLKKRRAEERAKLEQEAAALYHLHHSRTTDMEEMIRYKLDYDAEQRRLEKERQDRERAIKALEKQHSSSSITEEMIAAFLIQEQLEEQRRRKEEQIRNQQDHFGGSGGSFGGGGMSGGGGASRGF